MVETVTRKRVRRKKFRIYAGSVEKNREMHSDTELKVSTRSGFEYQKVAEKLGLGTYLLQQGRFCHVNSITATILGYDTPEEMLGVSLWDLIHPDDRKLVRIVISAKHDRNISDLPAFRVFNRDRSLTLWIQMGGTRINYKGRPASIGLLIDVTKITYKFNNMQDSLKRYETIFDDVDVQLIEMDLDGNITFINDAGCRIWDLPRHKLMGDQYKEYMDSETVREHQELYREFYCTGISVKSPVFDITDPNGCKRSIERSVSLIRDRSENITGFRTVTRDITDRKVAEDKINEHRTRLEAIFESITDVVITVDPNLMVIEVNKSVENICGIQLNEITGKEFGNCDSKCCQACHEVLNQTLSKKVAVKEYLIECVHQQRLNQVVSVSSSPLMGPDGEFMGATMVIRDMTLLQGLKRELKQENQFHNIIGKNKSMRKIHRLTEDLASLNTTVLVTGESGTGKELVARALHYSGHRSFKPFITVNCSALAESLLESELFGHVKGAFTGAVKDKQGRFQAADGGTILLDEIGDISPMIQMRLLRVLQEKEYERVGENTSHKIDVRVIACTNKDLKEKVRLGEFRQDLYYRLKVMEISIPPLRDRLEDLPLLVKHFRRRFNKRFNKKIGGISNKVLNRFLDYGWPGNVRELEHVIEHAFVLCHGGVITLKHLPADIKNFNGYETLSNSKPSQRKTMEAKEILEALNNTGWNKTKAARLLGIGHRTIYRKIKAYHLDCK